MRYEKSKVIEELQTFWFANFETKTKLNQKMFGCTEFKDC